VLLDALRDGPKHGYEIIKALEERSSGEYVPSPGTVYPTLQYLEDLGLVRAQEEADRRVYHLTEAGQAELEAQAQKIDAFWARFAGPTVSAATQAEIGFLQDELDQLARTVWGGLRNAQVEDDHELIHRVSQTVQNCRNEVQTIIADSPSA
jgi:DNA-binding PadR family transcriptional regulator